jgi:tetratricopeptide (TPR) repeat protein
MAVETSMNMHFSVGRYEESASLAEESLKKFPDYKKASIQIQLVQALLGAGGRSKVKRSLEVMQTMSDEGGLTKAERARVLLYTAIAYNILGDKGCYWHYLDKLIMDYPDSSAANEGRFHRVLYYIDNNAAQQALADIDNIKETYLKEFVLGYLAVENKDYSGAIQHLVKVVPNFPKGYAGPGCDVPYRSYTLLSECYAEIGDYANRDVAAKYAQEFLAGTQSSR